MASIWDWSSTAADNATADSDINWAEGQAPSTVNDSARFVMKRVKDFVVDLGGSITAGGTENALTVASSTGFTALANGRIVAFRAASTNTGAATLNVSGSGAKAIRKMTEDGEAALSGNEIQATGIYLAVYSAALASGAGAWLLLNPTPADIATVLAAATAKTTPADADTFPLIDSADSNALKELSWVNAKAAMLATPLVVESTDATASAGPDLDLYRNSASPAASDILGRLLFNGEDSAGGKETYALARAVIGDPTSTSEDAALEFLTVVAGTLARRLVIGAGMYMDGATGTDKGAGTVNATELYRNGSAVGTYIGTQDYAASAWVNFDGTGTVTIRDSHNVTSVSRVATGRFTVTFSTALADANYAVVATGQRSAPGGLIHAAIDSAVALGTTSFNVVFYNAGGGVEDPEIGSVIVFGGR